MPRGDTTGPMGAGRMTGRGLGFCAGYEQPGFMSGCCCGRGMGYGRGRGRGFGRGMGRGRVAAWAQAPVGYSPAPVQGEEDPAGELQALRQQAEQMAAALDAIQSRLAELADTDGE